MFLNTITVQSSASESMSASQPILFDSNSTLGQTVGDLFAVDNFVTKNN